MDARQPEARGRPGGGAATVARTFRDLAGAFRAGGLDTPELDARLLLCEACGLSHERFAAAPERPVAPGERHRLEAMSSRRLGGEPVSRILGRREFRGLDFLLGPNTLDPRPDTEAVVEMTVALAGDMIAAGERPLIVDLGTGSGCILVSVLRACQEVSGIGIDIDPGAVSAARANAGRLGVAERTRFLCGRWLDPVSCVADIVVANPPYIPSGDIGGLAPEVARFDPRAALDGGPDGCDAYRQIAPGLAATVRPGGWAVFETGEGRHETVLEILRGGGADTGAERVRHGRDLGGRVRCLAVQRPGAPGLQGKRG